MSGLISQDGSDDVTTRHYLQRLKEIHQKNPSKSSVAPSTVGSLGESIVSGHYFNNRGQLANETLTTQQFYSKPSNQDTIRFQAEPVSHLMEGSNTYSGASDASVFKKPFPVKKINRWPHFQRRLDLIFETLRSLDDKPTLKFMMTLNETAIHSFKNLPHGQPANPVYLMELISNLVKEEYFARQRIPKSICGTSVMLDQASNIDQYSCNSEKSIQLDKPFLNSEARGALQNASQFSNYRAQLNRGSQDQRNHEYAENRGGPSSCLQQETSTVSTAASRRGRHPSDQRHMETLADGSAFNFFNDSEIARKRDEAAAKLVSATPEKAVPKKSGKKVAVSKSTPKPTPNSSKISRMNNTSARTFKKPVSRCSRDSVQASQKGNLDQNDTIISALNGSGLVSRCGRPLKAPVKYWNSRGEEIHFGEPDESVFDQSMTLRSNKVLDKKKTTSVRNSKNNTPLGTIQENEKTKESTVRKPRSKSTVTGKENKIAEKKKPTKKQNDTVVEKNTTSRGKTNKKKGVTNQNSEKIEKKPTSKRKSKESNNSSASKKKKVEDPVVVSDDNEDDLFGGYKKLALKTLKVALSPSAGLYSAKKAAGEAEGKATPPCKAIGDMMMNESVRSTMSAAREIPKQNEVIRRVIKKVEKDQMKPASQPAKNKTQARKTGKEDTHLNNLMEAVTSSYSVANSVCNVTLSVFRDREVESDLSDMEQDEEDDDDDLV